MKKILLTVALLLVIGVFIIYQKPSSSEVNIIPSVPIPTPDNSIISTEPTTSGIKSSIYKDGNYIGKTVDAYFGNVQVQAVISGGKIIDIKFLQYPNDRPRSLQLSNETLPILRTETISAQSGAVDSVSGATQTSEGFTQSLASALENAKN